MPDIPNAVRGRKKYPQGSAERVTPHWQESVRAELRDRRKTFTWLGEQVGATKGAISQMLAPNAKTSRLVVPVCAVLELPPPMFDDIRHQQFDEAARRLREIDPRLYDELFARMTRRVSRGE